MNRAIHIIFALLLTGAAWSLEKVTDEQIAAAIKQLGAEGFRERKKAEKFLWQHGEQAEDALRAATKSKDPEIKLRAERILKKIDSGIFPDTPEHLADILREYSQGNYTQRRDAGRQLARSGPEAYPTLFRVLRSEKDQRLRKEILASLPSAKELSKQLIAGKIGEGQFERILKERSRSDEGSHHYVAYLMIKNRLADRVKLVEGLPKDGLEEEDKVYAAKLLRAAGKPKKAAAILADTTRDRLRESMLLEAGDYKTLAKESRYVQADNPTVNRVGYASAYYRLGGRERNYKAAIEQLIALGRGNRDESWFVTEALLINGEPDKAVAFLSEVKRPGHAYDILTGLVRMKEADEMVARAEKENPERHPYLLIAQAKYKAGHGEPEEAKKIFVDLLKDEAVRSKKELIRSVIVGEAGTGLRKSAATHALEVVKAGLTDFDSLVPRAFPKISAAWELNRIVHATESKDLQTKRFQELLESPPKDKEIVALLEKAELSVEKLPADRRETALRRVAELARKYGELKQEERLWTALKDTDSLQDLLLHRADLEADAGRWQKAYDLYWKHWQEYKKPTSLYLAGHSLAKTGKKATGKKLMDQAEFLPLGDEQLRWQLATTLEERGMRDQAIKQWELLLRTGSTSSWHTNAALRQVARYESKKRNHLRAAKLLQRSHLYCLDTSAGYMSVVMYLRISFLVHAEMARHWVQKKDFDRAVTEAKTALKCLPQNTDFTIDMVLALEKAKRQKDADELYKAGTQVWLEQLKVYPRSATAHNNLAWIASRCHRDLDMALERSTRALELSPDTPAYLDTMAEVHFQMGNREEAIKYAKKALAGKPNYTFFKERLKTFETAPLPKK